MLIPHRCRPRRDCAAVGRRPCTLDLRSGARKAVEVPPPRPYRRRRDMVVHSPKNFEVHPHSTASDATAAQQPPTTAVPVTSTAVTTSSAGSVPASVLAASSAAAAATTSAASGSLLGASSVHHDFDEWDGDFPPGSLRFGRDDQANSTSRIKRSGGLTRDEVDPDRISLAGSVQDDPTPPTSSAAGNHAQPNPFTPEWFAQVIGAAATAAATAVASSSRRQAPADPSLPRRLNERKVPDFWEDRPEFWFRIFDAHLGHFNPTEQKCFDALLPLLTPAARTVVHSVIRTQGPTPYTRAREALLRHFGRTPRQLAREFRDTREIGERLPSEFLDHLHGLLPDVPPAAKIFEVYLLDALPPNARVAALQHSNIHAMARAADAVVLENRASSDSFPAVNQLSLLDDDVDAAGKRDFTPSLPPVPAPLVAAVSRGGHPSAAPSGRKSDNLCLNHARWGKETHRCLKPQSCRMRRVLRPKPPQPSAQPAPGNAPAGGRQ